jgi:hypothetical protein
MSEHTKTLKMLQENLFKSFHLDTDEKRPLHFEVTE